ncbi:hypothetical protein ACJX0J_017469, partial [Zea mays]
MILTQISIKKGCHGTIGSTILFIWENKFRTHQPILDLSVFIFLFLATFLSTILIESELISCVITIIFYIILNCVLLWSESHLQWNVQRWANRYFAIDA